MRWGDLPLRPSDRALRQFAGIWLVFFGSLACWQGFRRADFGLAVFFAALAVTVGTLGMCWPRAVRPIYVAATIMTFPIGWVISHVILVGLFYGLITPVGLLFRLFGRDPLHRRRRPERDTCWTEKVMPVDLRSYLRQF